MIFQPRIIPALTCIIATINVNAFYSPFHQHVIHTKIPFTNNNAVALFATSPSKSSLFSTTSSSETSTTEDAKTISFIDTELRGAAMKLHTRKQAPKEGEAEEKPHEREPYTPTRMDYLRYLVDSQAAFQALEDAVESNDALAVYRNTGLERVKALETDIEFMVEEYDLERPEVGKAGNDYAAVIRTASDNGRVQEFMCHYYNFYFAHTAGGLMIGKQMSNLLLNKKTLEFYKWDGNIAEIKKTVKNSIEEMAATWNKEEKAQCVDATAAAFIGGGGINANLRGGSSPH